jgi:HAD superfamily hydrolase (TIGR01509 family)
VSPRRSERRAQLGARRIEVVTFDFGNTLVPVTRAGLHRVVETLAGTAGERLGPWPPGAFLAAWREERERQFREEIPRFREVDLSERLVRVLARLRGMRPPAPDVPWDQHAAARLSDPGEVAWAVEIYSGAFLAAMPPMPGAGDVLAALATRRRLAVLSNWPLAVTVDRYIEAAGWASLFEAVVVSQRVGAIKPHPAIFAAARTALGDPDPGAILHVGDDWAADVEGARAVGWQAAYVRSRPDDSPLPDSAPDRANPPELDLASLAELAAGIDVLEAR